MRWLTFLIAAGLALTLQSTIAPRFELWGARPDWLLVVVVSFAMHARMPDALIGAALIGAGADLMTIERPGLMAGSYLVAAILVSLVRGSLFRRRPLTQVLVTFAACLTVPMIWLIYRRALYDPLGTLFFDLAIDGVLGSIYTAAWAPPLHGALLSMARVFGLPRPRYTYAGLHRIDDGGV